MCTCGNPLTQVLDYENSGSHRLLGECQTSLDQLVSRAASPSPTLELVNPKKSGRKGYQNSGVLVVRTAAVKPRPSFLQYITGESCACGCLRVPGKL